MQHFVDAKLDFDAGYVYQDVNRAIQHVHRSGLVHRGILSDPQRYLVKNVRGIYKFFFSIGSLSLRIVSPRFCLTVLFVRWIINRGKAKRIPENPLLFCF